MKLFRFTAGVLSAGALLPTAISPVTNADDAAASGSRLTPPPTLGVEIPQESRNWAGYAAVRAVFTGAGGT
jgi:hypothetical protein